MDEQKEPTWKDILLSGLKSFPYRRRKVVLGAITIALVAYFLSGIYAIQPEELGVVVRFGKVVREGVPPGIHYHMPLPVERVYQPKTAEIKKVMVGVRQEWGDRTAAASGLEVLTGDTNVILIQAIIQYAISNPVAYLFATEDATTIVEAAAEEALTRVVGSMSVDDLLTTEKLKAQALVGGRVQSVLDSHGAGVRVIGAYFQEISPPVEVAYAFRDVASAREDKNRLVNEAEGYRNTILPTTRGQAQSMLMDAEGFSQERVEMATGEAQRFLALLAEYEKSQDLTASRIYVEKMEKILANMKIYILDKEGDEGVSTLRLMRPQK
jgi:membrane protease subunit HflK